MITYRPPRKMNNFMERATNINLIIFSKISIISTTWPHLNDLNVSMLSRNPPIFDIIKWNFRSIIPLFHGPIILLIDWEENSAKWLMAWP